MEAFTRIRAHHYILRDNAAVPFITTAEEELYREVALCAQSGSQEAWLSLPEEEGLFAGCRGDGKTLLGLCDFWQDIGLWGPAHRGLVLRHKVPALEEVKALCEKFIPPIWPSATYNQNKGIWRWPTGEQLHLAHLDDMTTYRQNYHGHSYSWILWEELTSWLDDTVYRAMFSCLRAAVPGMRRKMRATTNPLGKGHTWVNRRFQCLANQHPDHIIGPAIKTPGEPDRRVVYGTLEENPLLLMTDPTYPVRIKAAAVTPAHEEAWIKGSWAVTSGGAIDDIFPEVRAYAVLESIHPSLIPPTWRIDRALDYGEKRPFSIGYYAESDGTSITLPDGRKLYFIRGDLIRFFEWYGCHKDQLNEGLRIGAADIARGMIEREIELGLRYQDPAIGKWVCRVKPGPADDQIFTPRPFVAGAPTGSVAEDFAQAVFITGVRHRGIEWLPADKSPGSRRPGLSQLRRRLLATQPSQSGIREIPGLFITSNCKAWLETVPHIPRSETDPEDVDSESVDHAYDETRYRLRHKAEADYFSGSIDEFNRRARAHA
jgi:hypothetical protein